MNIMIRLYHINFTINFTINMGETFYTVIYNRYICVCIYEVATLKEGGGGGVASFQGDREGGGECTLPPLRAQH